MSRIGKNPIVLPAGVEVSVGADITVKGPLGTLKAITHPAVTISVEGQNVQVSKVEGAAKNMEAAAAAAATTAPAEGAAPTDSLAVKVDTLSVAAK